ncbi:MAG: hypothetical protein JXQ75_03195 [Phycisphaerae bacterium]|nr:hypothetical protein [Phycisphaerae bacterium]
MNHDLLHRSLTWLDHNRWTVISILLFALLVGGTLSTVGCQSTTAGLTPMEPGQAPLKVDRGEFHRQTAQGEKDLALRRVQLDAQLAAYNEEVAAFNERVEAGLGDLDRQDELRAQLLETVGVVATGAAEASLNPVSLIPLGIGLLGGALGLGTAADNRRKDRVITDLKTTTTATTT